MKVAKTAEQHAIEEAQWVAGKVAHIKGLKKPTDMQKLFATIAEIEAERRTPQQAKQLAAFIKIEKIEDRAREARATAERLMCGKSNRLAAKDVKAQADRRKILLGAMLLDQMKKEPAVKPGFMKLLNEFLIRPADRALFDLQPQQNSLSE